MPPAVVAVQQQPTVSSQWATAAHTSVQTATHGTEPMRFEEVLSRRDGLGGRIEASRTAPSYRTRATRLLAVQPHCFEPVSRRYRGWPFSHGSLTASGVRKPTPRSSGRLTPPLTSGAARRHGYHPCTFIRSNQE